MVSALLEQIECRTSVDTDATTCKKVLEWMDAHENALPKEFMKPTTVAQRAEYFLRNKFKYIKCKTDHPPEVRVLLEQIERRSSEASGPAPLKAGVASMQAVLRLQEKQCKAHRELVQKHFPAKCQEEEPQLQLAKGGRYPYPGLANVGNTCYLGAVLQCLLH